MPAYSTDTINPKYHQALVAWQKKNFPELAFLDAHWKRYYPTQTPYALFAKIGKATSETIGHGRLAGQKRLEKAGQMVGNMFYMARDIIRAQASTELGALQQHRLTLDEAPTDQMKVALLRIMAEELRHGYQMFWVLDHDESWRKPGHPDVAHETIEELLNMEIGSHVLDAFNIPFVTFLDNVVFVTMIDLVGKYQIETQKVFSYAPMARSMGPMLSEEGYHIGSGRGFLRDLALRATRDEGRYSLQDIQKTLNAWIPRGVETFGNERGGGTAMAFGFRDRDNGTTQAEYYREVCEIIEQVNIEIVRLKMTNLAAAEARLIVRRVQQSGETVRRISPSDLLFAPDIKFFRHRGMENLIYLPHDVHGTLLMADGQPIGADQYLAYLATQLPDHYLQTDDFDRYRRGLYAHQATRKIAVGA